MQQNFRLLIFLIQPYMFQATNSPIFRNNFWLYIQLLVYCVGALYQKLYTECNRRNGPDFGRVFLWSNYTDITQNTYIQS